MVSCSKSLVIASQFKNKYVQIVFIYLQQRQVLLELKMTCGQILSSLASQKYEQISLFVVLLLSFLLEFSIHSLFHLAVWFSLLLRGVLPEKIGGGVWPASQKPYPVIINKICSFRYPFYDLTKNLIPYLWQLRLSQSPPNIICDQRAFCWWSYQ